MALRGLPLAVQDENVIPCVCNFAHIWESKNKKGHLLHVHGKEE